MLQPFEEGARATTPEELMEKFLDEYRAFSEEFPEASGQWVLTRELQPIHNENGAFSLEITDYGYTGGAHPNTTVSLVTFDAETGARLGLADLLNEGYESALAAIAEQSFRTERSLEPDEDLSAAGFWFEEGTFRLNDNFAVVPEGLKFHFNSYEVGPYSMGPTSFVLRSADLAGLIRSDSPLATAPQGDESG